MSFRRLCGYDLNGWRDQSARNWQITADGELEEGPVSLTGAVTDPCVVLTGSGGRREWIGGAQAALSPHGLGEGWGDLGDPARRRRVRDCLADQAVRPEQLAAALKGLTAGAATIAISLEEQEGQDEALQDRLLRAVSAARLGQPVLVWRSVLALLGHLQLDGAGDNLSEGDRIGVICHDAEGFSVQILRLREEETLHGRILTPERQKAARHVNSPWGYHGLLDEAARVTAQITPQLRGDLAGQMRRLSTFALSGAQQEELLRDAAGRFHLIRTPAEFDLPEQTPDLSGFSELAGCQTVLFESHCSGAVYASLFRELSALCPKPLQPLFAGAVAFGAFEAARRLAAGEPVYYDFLPQISTIVLGAEGAGSFDLIEPEARLPAGRVYRSPVAADFGLQRGAKELKVYLRRELDPRPRLARHLLDVEIHKQTKVSLHIEQAPAAGRAQLIVEAPDLGRQFRLNWAQAEVCPESWEDLIAKLSTPPVSIPRRMVLEGGTEPWQRTPTSDGLALALHRQSGRPSADWEVLAGLMCRKADGRYPISSDGDLTPELPAVTVANLEAVNARAMTHLRARASGEITADNSSLKYLTWQFRRAPAGLARMLLDVLRLREPGKKHPFIRSQMSWILVAQGLGRICQRPQDEEDLLRICLARQITDWSYRVETAAVAFVLSRSPTAHHFLTPKDLHRLVKRIRLEFEAERGSDYTKFNYAPLLLAGLLRQRERDRSAFVLGRDPLAQVLDDLIDGTLSDFDSRRSSSPSRIRNIARYRPLLKALRDELRGEGTDPDILLHIHNLDDDPKG
ncbi:hypothetical protein [Falsigemmobacter faecalis]|uniref:Uncharacterized protein n=1 Tax=Falsigemmobacter faecalis TaxID=2488730 RepID=A0A3P3D6Y7_9RHOB|nr:hypothetical protein [Falsigemmobacter faecalis]RRH70145.1 hypothetical protein EG244_17290 [Falsigemmobacter faecalis]